MRKNVIFITIDAMGKWYIDQIKEKNSFFSQLEKTSYCANNMYSGGPFTEAALREMWASQSTLTGRNYLSEAYFDNDTIFEIFKKNDYFIYMGELIPFFNDTFPADNKNVKREKKGVRAFIHLWKNRLSYFIDIYRKGSITEIDKKQIDFILYQFFNTFSENKQINIEKIKFQTNKRLYIEDVLQQEYKSSLFTNLSTEYFFSNIYRNITNTKNAINTPPTHEEQDFLSTAKYKNLEYLLQMIKDENDKLLIEKILNGTSNRCIHSNNDLISNMRTNFEQLPKLEKELDTFIEWYDHKYDGSYPFFAYIHNYDFHFLENFINTDYNNNFLYINELNEKINRIKDFTFKKMSLSKQLSIVNIEKNLKNFWDKIEQRGIFDNTYVILTADHGIFNYMYPINRKLSERWNYIKTNFQIPFYIQGCNISPKQDNSFHMTRDILPTLIEKCELNSCRPMLGQNLEFGINKMFTYAIWINGIPDFSRQPIKIGIRSEKYSLTFEAYATQIFDSSEINGIYDLAMDPDECTSLKWDKVQNKEFIRLYEKVKSIWFNTIENILLNKDLFSNRFAFLKTSKGFFKEYNSKVKRLTWEDLQEKVYGKDIILFGSGNVCQEFINNGKFIFDIKEIWDNDLKKNGTYTMGHKITKPPSYVSHDNIYVIITTRYELEVIEQLRKMNVRDFLPCKVIGDYK